MIVLRLIRPDKVVHATRSFVSENLGEMFTANRRHSTWALYSSVFDDSAALAPLIFVPSPGADPMAALASLMMKLHNPAPPQKKRRRKKRIRFCRRASELWPSEQLAVCWLTLSHMFIKWDVLAMRREIHSSFSTSMPGCLFTARPVALARHDDDRDDNAAAAAADDERKLPNSLRA